MNLNEFDDKVDRNEYDQVLIKALEEDEKTVKTITKRANKSIVYVVLIPKLEIEAFDFTKWEKTNKKLNTCLFLTKKYFNGSNVDESQVIIVLPQDLTSIALVVLALITLKLKTSKATGVCNMEYVVSFCS